MLIKAIEVAVAVIGFGIIIVAVAFVRNGSEGTEPAGSQDELTRISARTSPPAFLDGDGDGLKDWEEALWGTNPSSADTDEDGTLDGKETRQNRNPLKAAPGDELFTTARVSGDAAPSSAIRQLPPIQLPISFEREEPAGTAETDTAVVPPSREELRSYAESPEHSALRTYGNTVAVILKTTVGARAETAAFSSFLGENAPDDAASRVRAIGEEYRKRASQLQTITPPSAVASLHAALFEHTRLQADAVERIASFSRASDIPLEEWMRYTDRVLGAGKAVYALAVFFKERGVAFSGRDAGSLFTLLHY